MADLSERLAACEQAVEDQARQLGEMDERLCRLSMIVGAMGTVARTLLPPDPRVVEVDENLLLVGTEVGVGADEVGERRPGVG